MKPAEFCSENGLNERRLREISIDKTVPAVGHQKTHRIDLGLALLSMAVKPGESLCQEDVAIWCGCSRGAIYLMEKRALKKLRTKIFFGKNRDIGKELEHRPKHHPKRRSTS